jgi:hypothetical protein
MFLADTSVVEQVERVIQSDTFRAAGVLRRLLRYLADKAFAGEADQLKEYTIGVDAFGKPPSYDPRQDAIVRLQIGRLRQKLSEYYRTEGKDDVVVLELPKGRFKLKWETRSPATAVTQNYVPDTAARAPDSALRWRRIAFALGVGLVSMVCWSAYSAGLLWRPDEGRGKSLAWTAGMEDLWRPFLTSKRRVVVMIPDPLFFTLEGSDVFFRKISLRRPEDGAASPELAALERVLRNSRVQPTFNFTPSGELFSSFMVAKLLGARRQDISLARSSQVPLQELADSNVILIGPEILFDQKLPGMQIEPQLAQVSGGIRNLRPRRGEPAFFADSPPGPKPNDGEVYALVSHAPGPLGNTTIETFTSSRTWGRQGAIQAFTDPGLAGMLADKLRNRSGAIPREYQLVLKVKFAEGLPTQISYVLHRDLASH